MDFLELERQGLAYVNGVASRADLLEVARSIGRPVPSPSGDLVRELSPTTREGSRRGTLSHAHATGPFPLHTDTAFWPRPSRYVVLRASGDTRRYTTVLAFREVFRGEDPSLVRLANESIWLVRTPSARFYCSMRFRAGDRGGWRYDGQCMSPANGAAVKLQELLPHIMSSKRAEYIRWTGHLAAVLCNWEVLHGRGAGPLDEGDRVLERVYVE